MTDFDVLDILIGDWLTMFTSGVTIAIANDKSAVKPDLPFITFRRSSLVPIGEEYLSTPDVNGKAKISGNRDLTYLFQCYGSNAMGILEELWTVRLIPASQDFLTAGGISLIDRLGANDITGLNDTEYESRSQMDLLFRFASQRVDVDVGLIEDITINGTYKDEEGNTSRTQTIDIDVS